MNHLECLPSLSNRDTDFLFRNANVSFPGSTVLTAESEREEEFPAVLGDDGGCDAGKFFGNERELRDWFGARDGCGLLGGDGVDCEGHGGINQIGELEGFFFSLSVVNDRREIRRALICALWSGRSEAEIALIVSLSGVQVWNLQSSRVVAVVCESIQERGRDEG